MLRMRWAALAAMLAATPAYGLDVTTCGQVVPRGETGVLQNDLDCSGDPPSWHVVLESRAVLDLAGHAILSSPGSDAIHCPATRCTVRGPGSISGGFAGITTTRNAVVENVTIDDVSYGVVGGPARSRTELRNVHVTRARIDGVVGRTIVATDVSANDGDGGGIRALGTLRGTNIVSSRNGGQGIDVAATYRIDGLEANDNGRIPLRLGAGLYAVRGGRLSNAVLTGNAFSHPDYGSFAVDIFAYRRPGMRNVACDVSRQITRTGPGEPLGICAQD